MQAPYTSSPPRSAWQANRMMNQSVPLEMAPMDPNIMLAAAQLQKFNAAQMISPPGMPAMPGMGMPGMAMPGMPPANMPQGGGMMNVPGGMMPGGMMPGGMMPGGMMPGGMMPGGMMPGGMMPAMPGAMPGGYPGMMPPGQMPMMGGAAPGAVAAVGGITGPGYGAGHGISIGRTQVLFTGPTNMHVGWLTQGADGRPTYSATELDTPGRYNFLQASIYGLKLNNIPGRPGFEVYPTLEVVPRNPKTEAFLSHSAVPVEFTAEDFREVSEGKYLVKVIYLPDPQFQELAATGTDQIVSTRLEPGTDPIHEAQRRGSILLVIRMGNLLHELQNTPPLEAPAPGAAGMSGPTPMMAPIPGTAVPTPSSAPVPPAGVVPAIPGGSQSPVSHLPDPASVHPTGASVSASDAMPQSNPK
jgi:hypothetical protein